MFANSHKRGQQFKEIILNSHLEAIQRADEIGRDNVIDGTVGSLARKGEIVTFSSIDKLIPDIDIKTLSAYSPMQGHTSFLSSIRALCFEKYVPKSLIGTIAVAGSNAGIHHAIQNYTDPGDIILTADWYWESYSTIVREIRRKLGFFKFFRDREFCHESFQESVESLSKLQENLLIILNTPGHNPTGYTISLNEWDEIIKYLNTVNRRIILLVDVAYLEYASVEYKKLFLKLAKLRDHVLVLVAYSISKGMTKYGLRTAALFAIHKDQEVIAEFEDIISITNQATYACVPSLGQLLTSALCLDKSALAAYLSEKHSWQKRLQLRADLFINEIDEYLVTPYKDGFFISIRTNRGRELVDLLRKENIFLVPVTGGVRVALCSIDDANLSIVAKAVMSIL